MRGLLEKKNDWTYNTGTGRRNILENEETGNSRMLDSWGFAALINCEEDAIMETGKRMKVPCSTVWISTVSFC